MILRALKTHNYRHLADMNIAFDRGLTALIGLNGSGKSTVLEALAWAMFGTQAARGTVDTIRWNRAKARSRVEVEASISFGGHEYRIVRSLHHAEAFLDGHPEPVAAGKDGVTAFIERQLGMTCDQFYNTYFTGQQELAFLSGMKGVARGHFISRVLGNEKLKDAQDRGRKRRTALRNEIDILRRDATGLPELRERVAKGRETVEGKELELKEASKTLEKVEKDLSALTPRLNELESASKAHQALQSSLSSIDVELDSAAREEKRAQEELDRLLKAEKEVAELRRQVAELPAVEARVKELKQAKDGVERRKSLLEQAEGLQEEIKHADERLAGLQQAPDLLERFSHDDQELRSEKSALELKHAELRQAWEDEKAEAAARHRVARARLDDLAAHIAHIEEAGEHGACSMCNRDLGEDYPQVLSALQSEREEVRTTVSQTSGRIQELKAKPAEIVSVEERTKAIGKELEQLQPKLTRCQDAIPQLKEVGAQQAKRKERLSAITEQVEALPETYEASESTAAEGRLNELRSIATRIQITEESFARRSEWQETLEAARKRAKDTQSRRAKVLEDLAALAFEEQSLTQVRAKRQALETSLRGTDVARTEIAGALRLARQTLEGLKKNLQDQEAREEEIARLEDDLRHHNELDVAFTELRQELNDRVRPELSDIASSMMVELTDGRYTGIELDEDYEIVVMDGGEARPVISGGENAIANLILRLALSQMVADRKGQPFNLLVLDEVFGSLDGVRRDNVMAMLRKFEHRFEQIVLITHVEEIQEGADHIIRLAYDPKTERSVLPEGSGDNETHEAQETTESPPGSDIPAETTPRARSIPQPETEQASDDDDSWAEEDELLLEIA